MTTDTHSCPKCGGALRVMENKKKRRLVGKCQSCAWWGTLGKTNEVADDKGAAGKEAQQPYDENKAAPRAGKRAARAAAGKRAKPARQAVRQPAAKPAARGFWGAVKSIFDTEL